MSKWGTAAFGDLYLESSRNGISVPKSMRGSGVPMVNMKELFAEDFISDQHSELVPVSGANLDKWGLKEGDLLFGRRSLTREGAGKVSLIRNPPHVAVFESSLIRVRLDPRVANSAFYYYLFKSRIGRDIIETIVEQVAVAGIRSSDLAKLRVPVPSVTEQRRIAGALEAFDSLREENIKNAARVRALGRELYEQFANSTPAVQRLGEVCTVNDTRAAKGKGTIRYIEIGSMGDGDVVIPQPIDWDVAPVSARVAVSPGSTLWSTVRPNRRSHVLMVDPPSDLVASSAIAVLRPTGIGPAELFAATDRQTFVDQLVSNAGGTAYPVIRPKEFMRMTIPRLSRLVSEKFEDVMWPLWRDADAGLLDNERLANARDELLPLLMAGRVRVEDVGVA